MNTKHTPGPLFVTVENRWPFDIVTKNNHGKVVFLQRMPCHSSDHKNAQEAITGKGLNPNWEAEKHNKRAIADEVLRAAAPELLEAAKLVIAWYEAENDHSKADFYQRLQMCRDSEAACRAAIAKATGSEA